MVTTEEDCIRPLNIPLHVKNPDAGIEPFTGPPATPMGHAVNLAVMTWPELEKEYVTTLLKKHHGNITWASKASGINRSTFASRMRKLNIRPEKRPFDE
jgi:transcriptional regulator of acetoin/glycerol metabolism